MAYTYDITTNRGKVRFQIGDTTEAHGIYTDAEIDNALTEGGSVTGAVAYLLRQQKSVHAIRGDSARVAAIDEALAAIGGDMPEITVTMPDLLPMDSGYDETDP